jgi:hypothetical protein
MKMQTCTLLMILFALRSFAIEPDLEKQKKWTKTHPVTSSDKITFDNRFGELKIVTWDRPEVKVDVTITATATTAEKAQQMLDNIQISDTDTDGDWKVKTIFKKGHDGGKNQKSQQIKIDYIAYLPKTQPLHLENQFGPIQLADYDGPLEIESRFGSIKAGQLSNLTSLTIEFGKLDIQSIRSGKLTTKFSSVNLRSVSGDVTATMSFCDALNIRLDRSLQDIDLRSSYSSMKIEADEQLQARFDITTHFGELKNKSNFNIKDAVKDDGQSNRGPKFTKKFIGISGKGEGNVMIRSEFGDVTISHERAKPLKNDAKKENQPSSESFLRGFRVRTHDQSEKTSN